MEWLALGSERSEFGCLPGELLIRMDRVYKRLGIPPHEQVKRMVGHYRRTATRRETDRLIDLEAKARSGKDEAALKEFNDALRRRAEERDTSIDVELQRIREARAERPGTSNTAGLSRQQDEPVRPRSISDRARNRGKG